MGKNRLTLNSTGATFASSVAAITTALITSNGTPPLLIITQLQGYRVLIISKLYFITGNQSFTGVKK
jgi:hypothetical protein